MPQKNFARNAIIVTLFNLLGSGVGIVNQALYAKFFGLSQHMDAYLAVASIPLGISGTFTVLLASVVIPWYLSKNKEGATFAFALLKPITAISALVALGGIVLTPHIVATMVNPQDSAIQHDAALSSVLLWSVASFNFVAALFIALLQSNHRFVLTSFVSVLPAACTLIAVFSFAKKVGIVAIAGGMLSGAILQTILLTVASWRSTLIGSFAPHRLSLSDFKRLGSGLFFVFLGYMPFFFTPAVTFFWAVRVDVGVASALGFANVLSSVLGVMMSQGIATVAYTHLSEALARGDIECCKQLTEKQIRWVLILWMIVGFFLIVQMPYVVTLLFQRGNFVADSTVMVSQIARWFMLNALLAAVQSVVLKVYHAVNNLHLSGVMGIVFMVCYYLVAGALGDRLGSSGIVVALLLSWGMLCWASVRLLKYRSHHLVSFKGFVPLVLQLGMLVGIARVVSYSVISVLPGRPNPLVALLVGGSVYIAVLIVVNGLVIRVPELIELYRRLIAVLNKASRA